MQQNNLHRLHDICHLTDSTYILRIERNNLEFQPGQHILLGIAGTYEQREYSIYSGTDDTYLEVLVKEVEDGIVSKKLKRMKPGEMLNIEGPVGFFTLSQEVLEQKKKLLFVATGTGIAPFHSMIKSIPDLNYSLIHGTRYGHESYGQSDYDPERYICCSSRDKTGDYQGRVSAYLKEQQFDADTYCYFCGNFNMIKDAMGIMEQKGISQEKLHTEVYF